MQWTLLSVSFVGFCWVFARLLNLDVENRSLKTRLYMATGQKP